MSTVEQAERELARLESLDEITADDLQRFKESLPTDPEQAEIVSKGLPAPWSEVFEYVSASERQSAYWRVAPDRSTARSEADREHREEFAETSREYAGVRGTARRDGETVPFNAALVGDKLQGRLSTARAKAAGKKALQRLRAVVTPER